MSHELRTPLNSILILGQQLSENPEKNLTNKQVEFARTIHSAGTDLLNLISDILDLSKIESGTVTVEPTEIVFSTVIETVARPFRHDAEARGLAFDVQLDPNLGRSMVTDQKRLQQVLKNLLSNAFKFTEAGGVRLNVALVKGGWSPEHPILQHVENVVAFEVADSGIGIAPEKQKIIFEAFQQADAGTSRKFGGTGLGLAISRELSTLLGGEIQLRSTASVGSTFTLYLPVKYVGPAADYLETPMPTTPSRPAAVAASPILRVADATPERIPDDRADIQPGDTCLLIVEDDPHYARVLVDLARDRGFKVLVTARGSDALDLAREFRPSAISLDVFLPDMLGWTVLSYLKQDPALRHIPVQIVTLDENRQTGLSRGAFSFITKPATTERLEEAFTRIKEYARPRKRRLLVVEDDDAEQLGISELLGNDDIDIVPARTGQEALTILQEHDVDCMVLDLRLPDISGFEVLDRIREDDALKDLPVVVFTGRELTSQQDIMLQELARKVVIKGVESPERLLDETALFLHRVVTDLPAHKQKMLEKLHRSDEELRGRKVLIVDDDVRNIFALGSVLERHDMKVIAAQNGREAIATLKNSPDISVALMDIMMPEMDGYETIKLIRKDPALRRLPIVALTAKAMKGDREKCIDAGASDYLAKPVNTEQLLATLRMWLHR
jgi:CheY-like chemotaxis protein